MKSATLLTVLVFPLLGLATRAEDWPQFRGPSSNGISAERGLNKDWNNRTPKVLWKFDMKDDGNAAPAVAGDRVYIVDHIGTQDIVRALDLNTGAQAWQCAYDDLTKNRYGFTVSTPLIDAGKIYILSRDGKVTCIDAAGGKQLWQRNLMAEIKAQVPAWDYAMSPVLNGDQLLFAPGGEGTGVVALDKANGKTLWQGGGGGFTSFATPLVAQIDGKKEIITLTSKTIKGVDTEGKLLWEVPWPTSYDKKGPSPVLIGERLLISTTEGGDTGLIEVKDNVPKVVWSTKTIQCHFTTPVFYHDRVWASSDTYLMAVEPLTGKILWKKSGFQNASLLAVNDTVIALAGTSGKLVMLDATADDYKELGAFTPLGGQSWTAPIVANGKLLVRNAKTLECLDLK